MSAVQVRQKVGTFEKMQSFCARQVLIETKVQGLQHYHLKVGCLAEMRNYVSRQKIKRRRQAELDKKLAEYVVYVR